VQAGWAVAAVFGAWVVANRVFGVSTGPVRPGLLLVAAAAVVGLGLGRTPEARVWLELLHAAVTLSANPPARIIVITEWSIGIVAGAVRSMMLFRAPVFVIGDSGEYLEASRDILEHFQFTSLGTIHPPIYPLVLAGISLLFGPDYLPIVLLQHTLGLCSCIVLFRLARYYVPPFLAACIALIHACNGYTLIMEHGIYTEAIFTPLLIYSVYLLFYSFVTQERWVTFVAGILSGALILTRLVAQPLIPIFLLAIASAHHSRSWMRILARCALYVSGILICYAPWALHNLQTSSQTGLQSGIGIGAILPRMWEEDLPYVWANPDHRDAEIRRVLTIFQEQKNTNASIGQLWRRVEEEYPVAKSSELMLSASIDVLYRNRELFIDRTWFRMKRIWHGGFAQETVHELYGSQTILGMESTIFEIQNNNNFDIEKNGNIANNITNIIRIERLPDWLTITLTILGVLPHLSHRAQLWRALPAILAVTLLFAAVMNADRARYRHPAEPFLVIAYAMGAYTTWRAAMWLWRRWRRHVAVPVDATEVPT